MSRKRRILPVLAFLVILLAVAFGWATAASAWSEGEPDPNGVGTHDQILSAARGLAGPAGAWLNMSVAQPASDDPDTVFHDSLFHIYDRWGNLQIGSAPSAVKARYDLAVFYLKLGNVAAASRQTALMAHYYSDVWNPFHSSYEVSTLAVQLQFHSLYESNAFQHGFPTVTQPASTHNYNPFAATVAAADSSRQSFAPIAAAYVSGAGYGSDGGTIDQLTKGLLTRAAQGLSDLIISIKTAAGK